MEISRTCENFTSIITELKIKIRLLFYIYIYIYIFKFARTFDQIMKQKWKLNAISNDIFA